MKAKVISRTQAVEKIEASKGKFFAATFIKKNGQERTINCNHKKGSITKLGYIRVNSVTAKDRGIKSIDPRTLKNLNIEKTLYLIRQ